MKTPNIVLIVVDTLRFDYFNSNVFPKAFQHLSKDSELYENVITPASWTVPSHASIFSKQYPSVHNIHKMKGLNDIEMLDYVRKENGFKSFVEKLRTNGYLTLGYSANPFISSSSIFASGFDLFLDSEFQRLLSISLKDKIEDLIIPGKDLDILQKLQIGGRLIRRYLKNSNSEEEKKFDLRKDKGAKVFTELINGMSINQPFFLFVNLMEMHEPYIRSEYGHLLNKSKWSDYFGYKKFSNSERSEIKRIYLQNASLIDYTILEVLKFLIHSKIYDDTMLIITSDHGQAFWECGFYSHESFLYEEIIRVPLLIKYPMNEKRDLRKYENKNFTTIDLGDLIQSRANGLREFLNPREIVFSESYGFNILSLPKIRMSKEHKQNVISASLPRKAIYKDDFKLVVNAKMEIECLSKKHVKVDHNSFKSICKELLDDIDIFSSGDQFFVESKTPEWLDDR